MSEIAIKVENLSKCYLLGHNTGRRESYTALRDVIARNVKNLARKTRDMIQGKAIVQGDVIEEFWSLNDLNFEIKQGESVGIIGRNGAGKSTLLKILSRITEPTTGRIRINGRVASLLEVGTGFHPELTGRENIFLNGAILGMSRREIRKNFDEIVDFAEVEKFLDTPVKRYSSGMYVRLAFAVAAHLEPDILVVDEVLAVGDSEFQKKCLGKMEDVSKNGRTVLFVSHNMGAIAKLCSRCIVLKDGAIQYQGEIQKAIEQYSGAANSNSIKFENALVFNAVVRQIDSGVKLCVQYDHLKINFPCLGFVVSDSTGNPIFGSNPIVDPYCDIESIRNTGEIQVLIMKPRLLTGTYKISLWFGDGKEEFFQQRDCLAFDVINNDGSKLLPSSAVGPVLPECRWSN